MTKFSFFFFIFFFQDPIERLGCHPQTGFADITSHVFFRAVDWEQVNRASCDVDELIGFRFIEVTSNQKLNTFQTMLFNFVFLLPHQLEARQIAPPFKPRIEDRYGLGNFDPQFTNEPVVLTPDDP